MNAASTFPALSMPTAGALVLTVSAPSTVSGVAGQSVVAVRVAASSFGPVTKTAAAVPEALIAARAKDGAGSEVGVEVPVQLEAAAGPAPVARRVGAAGLPLRPVMTASPAASTGEVGHGQIARTAA